MPLYHIGTFLILGASMFLATINFFEQHYQLMFAYLTAGFSWCVVAGYEYNERVFERAIRELAKKYMTDSPPEE